MPGFNETFFGLVFHEQLVRRWPSLKYPEERDDFKPAERYMPGYKTRLQQGRIRSNGIKINPANANVSPTGATSPASSILSTPVEQINGENVEKPPEMEDDDDPYLVDWTGEKDPDNPFAWSYKQKALFLSQIMLLTTSVYMGSSIVSPSVEVMAEYWHIGLTTSGLALSLFVFGYGIGPMIGLCAASEIPAIGRVIPYILTLFIFVILQIPTALVSSVAAFMILRFLAGLFGSPPLATGGASVQDVFTPMTAPLAMGAWGISASAGPILGPLIGGYATQGFLKTSLGLAAWRWTIWPLLILTGIALGVLIFGMCETSASNILARRSARLRKATGNPHLRSKGELIQASMTVRELVLMTFVRPFRLGLMEPIALSINLHIGLVYGVLYSFFEAFPIVFAKVYGFNLGENGLAYLGIFVATLLSYLLFVWWFLAYFRPKMIREQGRVAPEYWLIPGMLGGICLPASLFFFGWTATESIHWMVPIVGTMLFSPGIFGLFTSGLNYLGMTYPDYVASVFSANDFMRASIGAAMPLVSRQMFNNLNREPKQFPVAWGCTLVGCIALLMSVIPFVLFKYGPALRRASSYAKDPMRGGDQTPKEKKEDLEVAE